MIADGISGSACVHPWIFSAPFSGGQARFGARVSPAIDVQQVLMCSSDKSVSPPALMSVRWKGTAIIAKRLADFAAFDPGIFLIGTSDWHII